MLALPAYVSFVAYPSFTDLLIRNTEGDAIRVAKHLSRIITEKAAQLESSTPETFQYEVDMVVKDFHLMKLKLFEPSGKVIYSTDPKNIGQINENIYFHDNVTKGEIFTKVVKKGGLSLENEEIMLDVVETYVPIMQGKKFVSAFEIYYDITAKKEKLNKLLTHSSIILFSVTIGLLAIIMFILSRTAKTIAERERVEKARQQAEESLKDAYQEITALNKQLKSENLRMSAELDISRQLQQMLLPKEEELNQIEDLEIAGFMEPAEEVGGDYYDVLQYDGRLLFGIGDATGHGLESGLLALMTQSAVRTLLELGERDTTKFLNSVNGMIYKNVHKRMSLDKNLTLSLLEHQPQSSGGVLRISGQHEEMIVVRNGHLEVIDTNNLGFPVGFVNDISEYVAQRDVVLNKGDVVVLHTDGITEAVNPEQLEYGIDRLCEIIKQHWQKSAKALQQAVIDDVRQYIGQQKVFDDMTLLVLKQK